jgi:hypothetical protein
VVKFMTTGRDVAAVFWVLLAQTSLELAWVSRRIAVAFRCHLSSGLCLPLCGSGPTTGNTVSCAVKKAAVSRFGMLLLFASGLTLRQKQGQAI